MLKKSAEARLAQFLLAQARLTSRQNGRIRFHLDMSRAHIAGHLGLAIETLSRTIAILKGQGVVDIKERRVEILDLEGLRRIDGGVSHTAGQSGLHLPVTTL